MENKFLKNKIVIKYCSDYYRIINERFSSLDIMSDKVIGVYQEYIFSIDPKNKIELKKAMLINKAVAKYFDDSEFKKQLTKFLTTFKVPKGTSDIVLHIVNAIIAQYNTYLEGYTRNLYIPKWI